MGSFSSEYLSDGIRHLSSALIFLLPPLLRPFDTTVNKNRQVGCKDKETGGFTFQVSSLLSSKKRIGCVRGHRVRTSEINKGMRLIFRRKKY